MSMNLKKEGCCIVNGGEDLTTIDFGSDVNRAEKLEQHGASTLKWMVARIVGPQRATNDRRDESAPTAKSWSGDVNSVAKASIISKRMPFDSKKE
ncbi:hypothetical protein BHE74_00050260 [Ensete ventricosum]|nr:hypothetical protein BHE74_00050260 [Ensete ventricosum]RZS23210.1 hypothetical protein BHM03_00056108 [Ensete ventricosum]